MTLIDFSWCPPLAGCTKTKLPRCTVQVHVMDGLRNYLLNHNQVSEHLYSNRQRNLNAATSSLKRVPGGI